MLLKNKFLFTIAVLAITISCNKIKRHDPAPQPPCHPEQPDDTCDYWMLSQGLTAISGPATASVGQSVQLTVGVSGNSGCADGAQITGYATGNNISLTGNVHYHGCICTAVMTEETGIYHFTPTQAGVYTFQGTNYDGVPVTHTLVVQ